MLCPVQPEPAPWDDLSVDDSGEITQSKQVFSQHDTNFQLRRSGPVREELHISVSHPSKLPSDATSLLTDMSLFCLGYIDSFHHFLQAVSPTLPSFPPQ